MDEENVKPVASTNPAPSLTTPIIENSQKWETLNLHIDSDLAKTIQIASIVVIPVLPKTQAQYRQQFKRTYSNQKRRLRAVFKRIIFENSSRISAFKTCPNEKNSRHLKEDVCDFYFRFACKYYLAKLHQKKHTSLDLLESSLFFLLEASLEEIDDWIRRIEKAVIKNYKNIVEKKLNIIEILQKKFPNLDISAVQKNMIKAPPENNEAEMSMNELEAELSKLMISEMDPEKGINSINEEMRQEKRTQKYKGRRSDSDRDDQR